MKLIETVYNPVPALERDLGASGDLAAWGGVRHRFVTVGSLKPEKNHILLIRAFSEVLQTLEAKLIIAGDGPLRERLIAFAVEIGVLEHVIFPGYVSEPGELYGSAHVFVLTSDYEGYPLVLVEALRSGLTIVSTDCRSGPREILAGGFGHLVRCGDHHALARAMIEAALQPAASPTQRRRADEISGQATFERHLALMIGETEERNAH